MCNHSCSWFLVIQHVLTIELTSAPPDLGDTCNILCKRQSTREHHFPISSPPLRNQFLQIFILSFKHCFIYIYIYKYCIILSFKANPPREKDPRTRAITSVIRSPPALVSSSWKSRRPERKCETCGVVFSASVDPRVIEEHIAFHNTYHKKHD